MRSIEEMKKIPMSKFRREMNKWFRQDEPISITVKGDVALVVCPEGSEEFEFIMKVMEAKDGSN